MTLPDLVSRLDAAFEGHPHEVVLVDDGSPRETWDVVAALAARDDRVVGVRLNRNFGQHNALLAGVRMARYPVTVTMDDDLQHPPEEVPRLVAALGPDHDLVYGTPRDIAQNLWRRTASRVTRRLLGTVLRGDGAGDLSAFRAFRTELRDAFAADIGPAVSLDALLSWATTRSRTLEVDHHERRHGRSNYSLRQLIRHALDVSTGYSSVPLQIATGIGLLTALFGLAVLIWVVGRTLLGTSTVSGFPFLASTIAIFAGAQLITLGVIGEYLARVHFRVMRKPSYLVGEVVGAPRPRNGPRGTIFEEQPSPTPLTTSGDRA